MSVQVPNGVVDMLVEDEAEAVATAKKYLSYFQGRSTDWSCPDQRRLRRHRAGEPAARLRHARGDPHAGGRRFRAGDPPRLRPPA
jgi:acetyl-CoA carboxylase carboxyltransferase component